MSVVIDLHTLDTLGVDVELLRAVPGAQLVEHASELAGELRRAQAAVQYEPETDGLHPNVTVLITDHATAVDALTGNEGETYALILGRWDRAWIELAADGTPTDCRLPDMELDELGHCYGLSKQDCNVQLAKLIGTDTAEDSQPEPELSEPVAGNEPEQGPVISSEIKEDPPTVVLEQRFALQLFGNHSLTWNCDEVHFGRRACLELIAVMALTDWTLTRDELNEVVAADATLKQARSRRTTIINEARKALNEITGADDILLYYRSPEIYRLDDTWFHTDLADFDHNLKQAEIGNDTERRTRHLTDALRTYAGPVGADLDEAWDLTDIRSAYRSRAYQAAIGLAELHRAAGRDDQAAAVLERASVIDPDRLEAWEHLAEHHRRNGDEANAAEVEARALHRRERARARS